jgi:hypothetical protein
MKKLFTSVLAGLMLLTTSAFAFNLHIKNTVPQPVGIVLVELTEYLNAVPGPPIEVLVLAPEERVVAKLDDTKYYGIKLVHPDSGQILGAGAVRSPKFLKDCINIMVDTASGAYCMDDKASEKK